MSKSEGGARAAGGKAGRAASASAASASGSSAPGKTPRAEGLPDPPMADEAEASRQMADKERGLADEARRLALGRFGNASAICLCRFRPDR